MRLFQAVVLLLTTLATVGCLTGTSGRDHNLPIVAGQSTDTPSKSEIVYLDVALIEQKIGDRFLNHDLWELGDEQGVKLELKPLLEENGLRICQIGGLIPPRLQSMIASPRFCPEPRRLHAEPGKPTVVAIGPLRGQCSLQIAGNSGARQLDLKQAHCQFEVVPILEEDNQIRLRFTPQVRHGEARNTPRVEKDPDGPLRWAMEAREAVEEFPQLRWESTIAPNEYVIVGPMLDRPGTLGPGFFLPEGTPARRQWLLVLRASRVLLEPPVDESLTQSPPIAMQASWTSARGRRGDAVRNFSREPEARMCFSIEYEHNRLDRTRWLLRRGRRTDPSHQPFAVLADREAISSAQHPCPASEARIAAATSSERSRRRRDRAGTNARGIAGQL